MANMSNEHSIPSQGGTEGFFENKVIGHPAGLFVLFFTEMWERFSYYSIRTLLVLFMVATVGSGGFGFDEVTASAIYGIFAGSLYLAAVPGGWLAWKLLVERDVRSIFEYRSRVLRDLFGA